jgi:hypothetical protein
MTSKPWSTIPAACVHPDPSADEQLGYLISGLTMLAEDSSEAAQLLDRFKRRYGR